MAVHNCRAVQLSCVKFVAPGISNTDCSWLDDSLFSEPRDRIVINTLSHLVHTILYWMLSNDVIFCLIFARTFMASSASSSSVNIQRFGIRPDRPVIWKQGTHCTRRPALFTAAAPDAGDSQQFQSLHSQLTHTCPLLQLRTDQR